MAGFPVTCANGSYEVVEGLELNDFSRSRVEVTVKELKEERETIARLELV
jgi:malate dehydrogenase